VVLMIPRERVMKAIKHQETNVLPLDLGSTLATGIHVSSLHKLRVALGLSKESDPVKVIDPFQMLGEVEDDLRRALGIDTVPLLPPYNCFGFENQGWKPWTFFDGTPLLVPEKFNIIPDAEGNIYQYPQGDTRHRPSGKMPQGGFYHDILVRQQPFSEETLSVEKQIEEYKLLSEEDLLYYQREAQRLYHETDYAIVFSGVPGTNLGDIAFIPAPALPNPQGIRDIEEWYISLLTRQNFVKEVFAQITEIGLKNLRLFHQAVGNQIQVIVISGADFGSQTGPFISPQVYRELFKPFHQQINQWIHENTTWKTFIHTCGAIYDLLPDLKEAGFDILNPVQISAPGMEPERLKSEFGDHFTFWGGGVNTQSTLPFGSPEEVRTEVQRLIEIFRRNGGFVFATVHNIQANIPLPNLIALFETISHYR